MTKYLKLLLLPGFLVALFIGSNSASAGIMVFEDTLDELNGSTEIDFYQFYVSSASLVTISIDANGIDYHGSDLDSFIFLAVDDGNRTVDDLVAVNDDGGPGIDSLLTINLGVGNYLIGAGQCCLLTSEFVLGYNASFSFNPSDNYDYRLTISGDGVFTVPEPAPLALLGFGLFGLGIMRKRKN